MSTVTPDSEEPRVLVLLATYNGVLWLDEQLRSIVGQQGVRVSILANDDLSADGTGAFLKQWAKAHSTDLSILPPAEKRLGAAGNFLRLIREAPMDDFDAVALADQDDIWQIDRLSTALSLMKANNVAAYSSDVEAFWSNGRRKVLGKAFPQRQYDHFFEPAGPGCTYVLGPKLAKALQQEIQREPLRFEGIGYHDWLIYAYARCHGHRWMIDERSTVLYRQHGHNELGANLGVLAIPRRWHRLTSGWFRRQVLQIAGLWPSFTDPTIARLQRLSIGDRIWLAVRVQGFRRRPRDQVALAVVLLLGVLR